MCNISSLGRSSRDSGLAENIFCIELVKSNMVGLLVDKIQPNFNE
jgi:hypothetical protein